MQDTGYWKHQDMKDTELPHFVQWSPSGQARFMVASLKSSMRAL